MKNKKVLGSILLLVMSIIWGSAFAAQRMVAGTGLGPFAFCALRYLLATVCMAPVVFVTQRRAGRRGLNPFRLKTYEGNSESRHITDFALDERRARTVKCGLLAGVFMFLGTATQQMGLVTVTSGKAAFLTALYVILVPIGAHFFFRKRPGGFAWLGVLFGLVGLYFLSFAGGLKGEGAISSGDLLVLLCAVFWAAQILTLDHFMSESADPFRAAWLQYAITGVLSAIATAIFERPTVEAALACLMPILYTAILSTVIGFTLQIVAQQYTDPTPAALIMSLESVFGAVTGAIVLHEFLSGRELIGSAILFVGVVISQLKPPASPFEAVRKSARRR